MKEKAREMLVGPGRSFSSQDFLLAIIVSSGAIIVFLNGAMGSTGSPLLTAAILFFPTVALFFHGHFAGFRPNLIDGLFVGFVVCVGVTTLVNGIPPVKPMELLVLSLLNYLAARFLAIRDQQPAFVTTTGAIVTVGAVATVIALVQQLDSLVGKPVVFGFGHAATVFSTSLCFLAISLASGSLSGRRLVWACAGLFVPAAIFAASQVRFVFIALALALAVAAVAGRRRFGLLVMATLGVAILTGLAANHRLTALHIERDILGRPGLEVVDPAEWAKDPEAAAQAACLGPEAYNNSVQIRKVLLRDAIAQIPLSGFFGSGLASFRSPCLGIASPHNSLLQAIIEFGWIGGLAFAAMIAFALLSLLPLAFDDASARFVLCSLVFTAIVSMVYGRLEAEAILYLFLGLSAGAVNKAARS